MKPLGRFFGMLFLLVVVSGCTTSPMIAEAESVYNTQENSRKTVVDDGRTRALRSILPEQYQRLAANSTVALTRGASAGAYSGYVIATSQGVENIAKSNSVAGVVDAYNKALQSQAVNAAVGAVVGGAIVGLITDGMNKKQLKELYGIQGDSSEAFRHLYEIAAFHNSQNNDAGVKAYLFIMATMVLRANPEPQLGQLYVDSAYTVLESCHFGPWRLEPERGRKLCATAMNIMASLNLPNKLAPLPDVQQYMPSK